MTEIISIENREDIVRDANSKAILKTDLSEKKSWYMRKQRNNQITSNKNEINNIREELSEIKTMVKEIKNILKVSE